MSQPTDRVRIGFLMRLVAAVLDGFAAWVLAFVPALVATAVFGALAGAITYGLVALAYYAMEVFQGQSLGKMVFNYKITAQDGSPATRDQLIKRYAYKYAYRALIITSAFPFLWWTNFLGFAAAVAVLAGALMALQPEKLAFHDKLFKTAVFGPPDVTVSVPFLNKQLFKIPAAAPAPAGQVPPAPPAPEKLAA